jgi:hypothetical protein
MGKSQKLSSKTWRRTQITDIFVGDLYTATSFSRCDPACDALCGMTQHFEIFPVS